MFVEKSKDAKLYKFKNKPVNNAASKSSMSKD